MRTVFCCDRAHDFLLLQRSRVIVPAVDVVRDGRVPSTPEAAGQYPEDFVNRSHSGSGTLALHHTQLLAESEIVQEQASMRSQAADKQAPP